MALTRKQITTCISIVYIIFATALAGFASSRSRYLSIPIPTALSGLATALPIVAGIVLEIGYDLTRKQERRNKLPRGETLRPPLVIVANTIIFIYSTVVVTLLGTHAGPPSGLNCGLEDKWKAMFTHKDEESIRRIQDAFRCCGFRTSHDRAWPFPDKSHDAFACEKTLERTNGCFGAWKAEEQNMAGILMGVVGLVFVWQVSIIVFPTQSQTVLHRVLPEHVSRFLSDQNQNRAQGAIEYLPNFSRYSDRVEDAASDSDGENPVQNTIEGGAQHVRNALGAGQDEERAHPSVENEWSRN
ncbi:hypothetical protein EJ04DRAFT_171874 [Polyplosphaeria fusca]|uniref:Tetraspanin Tsp3 n=1 Tax=Polyplosphaeria fusca TaxID=682080 RepID=A0A9P4QJN5_9PLEO|nr:hypothetical protein EJ04DRAFT_171874 [Polyplosphaeria fusca]